MPLYEYRCLACQQHFEALVRRETLVECPACHGTRLDRLASLSSVHSEATRNLGLRAAKKRDAAQGRERMHEQLKYEQSHDRHG